MRGISEVLARLEKSNTKLLSHVGGKRSDTASVTSAQKSKHNAKTKSDESTSSDLHDLMAESGNFDEMLTPPIKKRYHMDRTNRRTRRESRLIKSMKYNITRADMSKVYNMKTTEPFAMRLTKLTPSAFLSWFTKWNEHMHRTGCFTAPTSLISEEIRETLMDSTGCTMEEFHELEPDQFIEMVADQIKCRSKSHFATIMKNCYGKLETKVYSDKMLELSIQFQQVDGSWFTYTGLFVVLDMKENEVIIGLPAILKELWTLFVSTVEAKKRRHVVTKYMPVLRKIRRP